MFIQVPWMFVNAEEISDPVISIFPTRIDQEDQQLQTMKLLSAQVEENPCQTIEELSNALKQPWSTIQEHLQSIGKTASVWFPHNLSEKNRASRSTTCNLLLQRYNTEPFFAHLITADEKWVLYDNPNRKRP
ncbi:histone-lysine N-methyltransferase SETMAR [Trichonephila clavipes]|nr:histone-lysine N-methyltransferase SETMAR [Trichonephila clavipes]